MSSVLRARATAARIASRSAPASAARAAAMTRQPSPPAPVWPSTISDPHGVLLGDDASGLAAALARARQPARDVDRDDVAARGGERLEHGQEVADRRLRGDGQVRRLAEARVERVEVLVLELGAQVPAPADVEADLLDAPPLEQRPRQVGRAVGDDGDRVLAGHAAQPTGKTWRALARLPPPAATRPGRVDEPASAPQDRARRRHRVGARGPRVPHRAGVPRTVGGAADRARDRLPDAAARRPAGRRERARRPRRLRGGQRLRRQRDSLGVGRPRRPARRLGPRPSRRDDDGRRDRARRAHHRLQRRRRRCWSRGCSTPASASASACS